MNLPAPPIACSTRPSLVVISGGAAPGPQPRRPVATLAAQLPVESKCALQVGGERLGNEDAGWTWIEPEDSVPDGPFDLFVLGPESLGGQTDSRKLLRELSRRAAPRATLLLDFEPQDPLDLIRRCVEGDMTDADGGPLSRPLRWGSCSSVYKLLMDAGWMPDLAHATPCTPRPSKVLDTALDLAASLGVPHTTALRFLGGGRMILRAQRLFEEEVPDMCGASSGRFAVVVPTNRESQLRLNVECSPGLQEVDARIVSYRGASSPAEALERSCDLLDEDWVLFCHQDVYFPAGFGTRLRAHLATIPADERDRTLIGFAGMGVDAEGRALAPAGFVIDRLHRFDHPANERATSIDELAIVIARESLHRIDPQLGWHLWATDLCLSSITRHQSFPSIVRLPLFHNSLNDYALPEAFHQSAQRLATKHVGYGPIQTLCGTIPSAESSSRLRA